MLAEHLRLRFDGWFFTAVRTTGIYCRPSCPARTPMRSNVVFFPTAATAQRNGFRACKRCRPDVSPGSPEWDSRSDLVARAMVLIADGVVDREGVSGLAARLAYSERQLNRIMTDELGVGPLAVAREHRARHARTLIETTDLAFTDVAFAAGFGSVRQFNDSVSEAAYGIAPGELRRRGGGVAGDRRRLTLAARPPFAATQLFAFLARPRRPGHRVRRRHDIPPGADTAPWSRRRRCPRSPPDGRRRVVDLALADLRDLKPAVHRLRRLLDLDADPVAVDAAARCRCRRSPHSCARRQVCASPGSVDPFETAVKAVVGQQVSISRCAHGGRRGWSMANAERLTLAHDLDSRTCSPRRRRSSR